MAGREGRRDHRECATIAAFCRGEISHSLMHDAEVIESAGEIRMRRAKLGFLARERRTQMIGGAREIACRYGLLCCIATW